MIVYHGTTLEIQSPHIIKTDNALKELRFLRSYTVEVK